MIDIISGLLYSIGGAGIFVTVCIVAAAKASGRISREEEMEADISGAIEGDLVNFARSASLRD